MYGVWMYDYWPMPFLGDSRQCRRHVPLIRTADVAYLYSTIDHLDPARRAFALGLWIKNRNTRQDRFKRSSMWRVAPFLNASSKLMALQTERRVEEVRRHISALRAFHTGLIAETARHLDVLNRMAHHIDVLRQPGPLPHQKLAAAHASCQQLTRLEGLKPPWRETYRDLRRTLLRVRALYREIVKGSRRHRT